LVEDMRDSIAAGHYPSYEMVAVSAWNLSTTELTTFSNIMANLPDSIVDDFYDTYSPGSTDIPWGACVNQGLGCATCTLNDGASLYCLATAGSVTCSGNNNGTASASIFGGSTPYSYSWSNGA